MKDLVKFIVENHDKFEYDENGRIINLEECYIDNDSFKNCNGIDFSRDKKYRLKPKPQKVHFEYEDFVEEIKKNGGYVMDKFGSVSPMRFDKDYIRTNDDIKMSYVIFCNHYTRLDGTKFEKEVVDEKEKI